ncbi:V-type proton ATPase subunit E [Caloramator mitchellensis]|uniref:V-type proton ATPase subunit E n=1 Tax=Caloramator mitchellensis TaxID=908809 RepID=A0A0R3JUY2_CALMK|nr:V-type ATP synthase subunit E [Caloramator mitchellensis]KRQ87329.1 V-type proton ATPase subunit E [Caloramator mitchellensis]
MAGIDNLKERLLSDAKAKALEIENQANAKADEILKEANLKAERIIEEIKEKAEKEGKELKERIISKAKMQVRDMMLKQKQDSIDNVFNLVIQKINSMDINSYKEFIKKIILNNVEFGDEEIVVSAKDKERIDNSLIAEINSILVQNGKMGSITLSPDTANISSGFIMRRKGLEINCTIESIIRNLRDEIETEIANIIF